jgi:hypothetical protein
MFTAWWWWWACFYINLIFLDSSIKLEILIKIFFNLLLGMVVDMGKLHYLNYV